MAESGTPDGELVRRARRGDDRAFDTLVRRYLRPALAVAWEYAEAREDAEDLVQEAFYRALRRLDRFDPGRPFPPWFFSILRNAGRNAAAARGRWRTVPVAESLPAVEPAGAGDADPPVAERLEIRERVGEAVEGLAPNQRACFRLCELEGFSRAEVATMLGVSEATVRVHLHRARRSLRAALEPLVDEGPG